MKNLMCGLLAAGLLATAPMGCAGVAYVQEGPPPLLVEVRPAIPGPRYVWIDGNWHWNGYEYVWISGHWHRGGHGHWVPGRWAHYHHGWRWHRGYWRR